MRPRRAVDEYPDGYGIAGDPFRTTDRELARAVAKELDRIDPLPCRTSSGSTSTARNDVGRFSAGGLVGFGCCIQEHDDWVEITQWGNPTPVFVCAGCGKRQTEDPYLEY
jgi:hypothetical protein